jgi:Fusaric acid resistance protein-like
MVAGSGAVLTWVAFTVGQQSWPWVTLAAFVVTVVAGLFVKYGLHRFVLAYVLNIWFIIALSQPPKDVAAHITIHPWGQTLAWLIGGLVWIACLTLVALARSRADQPAFIPEIAGDISPTPLTPPKIAFALMRAVGVAAAIAIAFGFQLPQAQWMDGHRHDRGGKAQLTQSRPTAAQRAPGAIFGALVAALAMLSIDSKGLLEAGIVVLGALAGAIRTVNYTLYFTAVSAFVLIAVDLSQPTNFTKEAERVAFTLAGVAIAILVEVIATKAQERRAPQPAS